MRINIYIILKTRIIVSVLNENEIIIFFRSENVSMLW